MGEGRLREIKSCLLGVGVARRRERDEKANGLLVRDRQRDNILKRREIKRNEHHCVVMNVKLDAQSTISKLLRIGLKRLVLLCHMIIAQSLKILSP